MFEKARKIATKLLMTSDGDAMKDLVNLLASMLTRQYRPPELFGNRRRQSQEERLELGAVLQQ
jgi:hypothetical protein